MALWWMASDCVKGNAATLLVDGASLLDMLEEFELGLRPVAAYEVNVEFFEGFMS